MQKEPKKSEKFQKEYVLPYRNNRLQGTYGGFPEV